MFLGVLSSLAIILLRKRGLVALARAVVMSMSHLRGTVGLSAVCDCSSSWSRSTFFLISEQESLKGEYVPTWRSSSLIDVWYGLIGVP